jgi:O-antigen/teichoic acid export membrane protein
MALKRNAASGVKWSTISQAARQGMQFITIIILARLLSPSDFGLMGMALVVIVFVTVFKDLGTAAAVIQQRTLSDRQLSSIFWVNVAFGFIATVLIFVSAPLVAYFYHEERLTPILEVLSLSFVISGIGILQQALLERELAFRALAKVETIAVTSGAIVGVGSALLDARVWSLVYQALSIAIVTTVLLWVSSAWRPRLVFDWTEVKAVSNYSLNLTGFNIFNYFCRNADYLLIGRFLGAQDLGYYTLAYRIMLFPVQSIIMIVTRVMFPVYSQLQDDDARLRRAYLKVAGIVALITFPMMFGVMALSKPFVLSVFGSEWMPIVVLLVILAPVGLIQSVETTVGAIYQAKGRTDWMLRWGIAEGLLTVIAFVIGLRWGIIGVAAAYAVVTFALVYPNFSIPFRLVNLRVRDLGWALWRPLLSSLLMFVSLMGLKTALLPTSLSDGLTLVLLVPIGVIIYLAATWVLNQDQVREILSLIRVKA